MVTPIDQGDIVLRDGVAIAKTFEPFAWLLKHQGQSVDYALTHAGYSVLEDDPEDWSRHGVVRGWVVYLKMKEQGGHGTNGAAVRLIEEVIYLTDTAGGTLVDDYILTGNVVKPMLSAALTLLNYTSGDLAIINGELDTAIRRLAIRWGIDPDTL